MFIKWDNQMSVGVQEIDRQHKQLIALINKLYDSLKTTQDRDEILQKVLNRLIQYTIIHFAVEESLMNIFEYPDHLEHKKIHRALEKQVIELQNKIQKGQTKITIEVIIFLRDWVRNHILIEDKKYGPYLTRERLVDHKPVKKKLWVWPFARK
jgi:hemerythrin